MTSPRAPRGTALSVIAVLALVALASTRALAQSTVQEWETDLGFSNSYSSRIATDSLGNTYACSGTNLIGLGSTAVQFFQTSKVDPDGNLVWTRDHLGGWNAFAYWLAIDSNDDVIVAGSALQAQSGPRDLVVVKYDSSGNTLWTYTFAAPTTGNSARRVEVDADDNIYVASVGAGPGGIVQISKLDPAGNLLWMDGYTPASGVPIALRSLDVSPSGRSVVTSGINNFDFSTRVLDSSGTVEWSHTYAGGVGGPGDVKFGPDGSVYVCGAGDAGGFIAGVVVKYDPAGNLAWEHFYNGPFGVWDSFLRLAINSAGHVIAVGRSAGVGLYTDWSTIELQPSGQLLWSQHYSGFDANDEWAVDVRTDASNRIYVLGRAGNTTGPCVPPGLSDDVDTVAIRYSSGGDLEWVAEVGCTGQPSSIALAPGGGVVFNSPGSVIRLSQAASPSPLFIRGDCNDDLGVDIADAIATLQILFVGGTSNCDDACDSNDDGGVDISDAIFLLAAQFSGGPGPAAPFPDCGEDPTADAIDCVGFGSCP